MRKYRGKNIIYLVVLLLTLGLTIGFSAFQNELFINDILLKVRLQRDVRVSESVISKSSGAVVNDQEYNKTKLLGNVTFDSTSSYVLYKVDLTNYGNVKSGLLNISGDTGLNVSICDSNGSNCTNNLETPICSGSNCTLGATKEVYVKVSPTTSGTKNIDLDLDIQPYVNITYDNIRENTSDFKTEVLETSTYQITLTSKPEEVEVSGDATVSYNKNTGVLVLSNIQSDLTIQGKYLINTIAEESYTGTNPDNYVRFNNSLFRIITKENVEDGYGNTELRTKIISNTSIGNSEFSDEYNEFHGSIIEAILGDYNEELITSSKELIDTVQWTNESVENIGIINSNDYTNNSNWLTSEQYTLTTAEDNKVVAVTSTGLVNSEINVSRPTYPVVYLKTSVLVVGGNGTESNPYILDLASNGLQPNPTVISRRTLTVTGANQELVTVSNKVGTPWYSIGTQLNSSNYSSGSTTIPSRSDAGSYTIYYYIPAEGIYKAKSGSVTSTINGLTFTITYQKGSNVSAIGKTSDSCTTTGSSLTCSVTLPSITPNNGYESVGWSLTNGDTTGVTGSYTLSANGVKLYANAVIKHNYQNTTTNTYYAFLNDAFSSVSNNQTIKVLEDVTETVSATLATGKTGIKLDLNGKTITMDSTCIQNNGELDIYNTSSTTGEIKGGDTTFITNNGVLSLNGTSMTNKVKLNNTSSGSYGTIRNMNSKSLTINNNVEINTVSGLPGIYNSGITTILGGIISGYNGIINQSTGELNLSGSSTQITGESLAGIRNYGVLKISDGTIIGLYYGIDNSGTVTIEGGTITGSDGISNASNGELNISGSNTQITGTSSYARGIVNYGTATISGGTITGPLNGISNSGTATITGGTITGSSGIANDSGGELNISGSGTQITGTSFDGISNSGTATISGGVITGNTSIGIYNNGGSLTLGTNDSSVSTTSPLIQTLGTSNKYGVYVYSGGTFNFYDGIIKSASGSGYAINNSPTNMADNYKLQKTVSNGVESAILVPADYKYINTTTNARYETLNEAFNSVANNQTIKVLEDVTETTNATLASGKTGVKLDLNGKTVTFNNSVIENLGELDIYNTSSTDGKIYSTLAGEETYLFSNGGTLTFNGTSSSNKIIINKTMYDPEDQTHMEFAINNNGSLIINDNTEIDSGEGTGVHNTGTLTITGGTITGGTITGGGGIYNESTGEVNISGNNTHIVGGFIAIYNEGTTNIAGGTITGGTSTEVELTGINNWGTATITGGTISGSFGIRNASTGELNISGSSTQIIGTTDSGIINRGGTATVTGGTITGLTNGIYLNNGTLTLGTNDSTVSTTSPVIQSTATTNAYGININTSNNPTFNFYDGVIKSSSGSGYAISDNPTNIPEGYRIQKTVSSGVESAILVERQENYINTTTNEIYETLNDAFSNASNNQTIKVLKDVEEIASSALASSKTGIKLDLNGKTINLNGYGITNNGSLEIKDSSETPGSINDYPGITNETAGTLFINGVNITGDYFSGSAFVNEGIATITDSSFIGGHAVVNTEDATLTINGNSYLEGREYQGLSNRGTVVINNGEIKSLNDNSIYNSSLATLTINGGTITAAYGISNYGNLTITSGNVTASRGTAIYLNDGTLTLGTDDSTVSTTLPLIQTNASSSYYGIDISTSNNPIFNFYDGIIKANGSGRSISGDPTEVANLYQIKKSVDSGVESAYLIKLPSLMEGTYGDETTNYLRTNIKKQDIESLTFANSLGGHTVNGTDCWDVSTDEDGTVLAWVTDGNSDGKYEMTIGSNGTVYASSGYYLFSNLKNLDSLNGMNNFDTSKVTNMISMFSSTGYNSTTFTLDLGDKFDTSKVTDMYGMFSSTGYSSTVFTLDLGDKFDTSKVTDMGWMFYKAGNNSTVFTLDLGDKFDTSKVTDMQCMFSGTGYSSTAFTLDLGDKFDTSNVTNMQSMFFETGNNSTAFTLDLGDKFDTSNVTNMQSMFFFTGRNNIAFTLDLGDKFDTSNVTNMRYMFSGTGYNSTAFTLDLGDKFDTSKVEDMRYMFDNAKNIKTIYAPSSFVTTNVTNSFGMFNYCTSLVGGLGTAYNSSNPTDKTYAHIDGGTSNPGYFTDKHALLATIYYSNGTNGTINTITTSCRKLEGQSGCTITVPSEVTSSVGKYDTTYGGVTTSFNSMSSSSLTISNDSTFYAYYSSPITIYYPNTSNGVSSSSNALYRNEYFTSDSTMNTITATSGTSTTQTTTLSLPNLLGTFEGFDLLSSYPFAVDSPQVIERPDDEMYGVSYIMEDIVFHYNSNTTSGSFTDTTSTSSVKTRYFASDVDQLSVSHGNLAKVPSAVSGSVGKYNSAYKGMSSSSTAITNVTGFKGGQTYYAYYSSPVTIYYPSSTTARGSYSYYRNEYYNSAASMNSVINSSQTSTTNFTFSSAVSGYSLYGFADNASTNTRVYDSVSALAASNKTTSYAILRKSVTATFYYNSNTTAGSLTASTATASGYQYLRCTSTAAETSNGAISVPSAVSGSVGKQNSTYKSVYTSLSNMGSVSPTTGYTTYYANYSKAVTNYYYGSSYTSRTLYRNEYFSSTSAMGARLATANNSTTNYTTAVGPGSSVWTGLSTGQDTTQEYSSVQAAADSSAGTLYTVYTFNVTYQKGSNVSAIGSTSGSCKVTTSSTSCNVTLPSITPNSGYISAGWSTTNGATSGTAAGSSYSLSANARTLYGNAKENATTLSIGSCTGSAQAHSICNTSAVAVPSGFRSPSKITFTWTNETVTNGSPAGDMVAAAQYSTNNGSSWTYFSISGGGTYYYGAGKYCGDYVTSWSGSADAGSLPSNITHIRLVVYSNANAYAYSSIKLGSGSVKIWGS